MNNKLKTSTKLSDDTREFLKKFDVNRIRAGTADDKIGYSRLLDLIVKYFKLNNDSYLGLVSLKEEKRNA